MLNHPSPGVIASSHRNVSVSKHLFAWGNNSNGQLGDGTTTPKSSPVPIGAANNWTAVAAGGANSLLFSLGISGGALFAWGNNSGGKLGDGTTAAKSSPVPIGAATNWTAVAAGYANGLGISGGALFAWGGNGAGQLGDGTTASKSSPVPIGAATNWTAVSSGGSTIQGFSLGIRGGSLFAWGYNINGQLGDGTTAAKSSPVPIGAATSWTAVAAGLSGGNGGGTSLGISGGALFAWGANGAGQLGDGTTTKKSSPVPIGAATNWTAVACAMSHLYGNGQGFSLGISGGALFAWGNNAGGQLGDGTTAAKSSPVPIGAATNWTAVAAGGANTSNGGFSLGIRGGSLFAWGNNNNGQLGDGTTASKSSPVPIGAVTSWTVIAAAGSNAPSGFSLGIS